MKRMLKSTLAICLVLMMALSTIAVSATTTEAEAAELTTVYTKDFTKETDLTGWTNQSAWSYNSATASNLKTNIAAQTVTFYENNLGDNFEINATMGYSYNGVEFLLNGNGSTNAEGMKVYQGKGTYTEEFDEADEAHQTYKEKNPNAQKYSYTIETLDVYINGKKPADWKTLLYVDDADKDRAQVQTMTDAGAIKNVRATNLEYKTENVNISYNNGTLSFKAEGIGYGEIREFTYDVTQGGTVVPPTNKGYFGLKTESGAWLYNIEIKKELSDYITVYEQDFTEEGATTEGFDVFGATVDTTDGLKIEENQSFVYNEPLGNKWRVSGKMMSTGWNTPERDQYSLGYNIYINSDAEAIETTTHIADNGYVLKHYKNSYELSYLKDSYCNGWMGHYKIGSKDQLVAEPASGIFYAGDLNFEIEMDGTKLTYILTSLDGATVYSNETFDVSKNHQGNATAGNWVDGLFGIKNNNVQTKVCIKDIKIEKAISNYITIFDADFTEEGLSVEDITNLDIDVTSGVSVDTTNGLTLPEGQGFVYNKNIGTNYRISGQVKASCWSTSDFTQYNTHYRAFLNSNAQLVDDTISATDGIRMGINKNCNEMTLLIGGIDNGTIGGLKCYGNEQTSHTSINGVFVNFVIEMNGNDFRYTITSLDGATTYLDKTFDFTEKKDIYKTTFKEYEKFAILNNNRNTATYFKNLKIEAIKDYAVADAEAYVKANGNVKYSAIVHNNSGNSVTGAVLVAAAYDADKNLIGATVIDDYTGAVGKQLVDGEIEIENGEKAEEVVIYFWDNFDSAYPLYEQTTIEL